jgi:hypothetical protein
VQEVERKGNTAEQEKKGGSGSGADRSPGCGATAGVRHKVSHPNCSTLTPRPQGRQSRWRGVKGQRGENWGQPEQRQQWISTSCQGVLGSGSTLGEGALQALRGHTTRRSAAAQRLSAVMIILQLAAGRTETTCTLTAVLAAQHCIARSAAWPSANDPSSDPTQADASKIC